MLVSIFNNSNFIAYFLGYYLRRTQANLRNYLTRLWNIFQYRIIRDRLLYTFLFGDVSSLLILLLRNEEIERKYWKWSKNWNFKPWKTTRKLITPTFPWISKQLRTINISANKEKIWIINDRNQWIKFRFIIVIFDISDRRWWKFPITK